MFDYVLTEMLAKKSGRIKIDLPAKQLTQRPFESDKGEHPWDMLRIKFHQQIEIARRIVVTAGYGAKHRQPPNVVRGKKSIQFRGIDVQVTHTALLSTRTGSKFRAFKDNEGLGFHNEENRFDAYENMEAFLHKYLD